ncbi:Hypothetical_protein [Hexamita inflata]|uniref:Hypothetical_protein n=1 Tax=Hexamita inflata TaxID=28002 RepID=A0AA86P2Y7_9EUKA|nr:Hypothetical protein HINF_LOCUS17093 [Hexamita inflata]CAI9929449.1 Hypothetical protein HINF_LOCUS17094 [Hexamita inflata]
MVQSRIAVMKPLAIFGVLAGLFSVSLASIVAFLVKGTGNLQTVSYDRSVTMCPDNVPFDQYFCAGVDLTRFSKDYAQGRPDGLSIKLGNFSKYNFNFSVDLVLNFKSKQNNPQLRFQAVIFGSNDYKTYTEQQQIYLVQNISNAQNQITIANQLSIKYATYKILIMDSVLYEAELSDSSLRINVFNPLTDQIQFGFKTAVLLISVLICSIVAYVGKKTIQWQQIIVIAAIILLVSPLDIFTQQYLSQALILCLSAVKTVSYSLICFTMFNLIANKSLSVLSSLMCTTLFTNEIINCQIIYSTFSYKNALIIVLTTTIALALVHLSLFARSILTENYKTSLSAKLYTALFLVIVFGAEIYQIVQMGHTVNALGYLDTTVICFGLGYLAFFWEVRGNEANDETGTLIDKE